jgi:hypothetical protein
MPDYHMKAETGSFALKGQNARLIHIVTFIAIKKNKPWIVLYAVVTIVGIVMSYFLSGWLSVIASAVVALTTFGVGLLMGTR